MCHLLWADDAVESGGVGGVIRARPFPLLVTWYFVPGYWIRHGLGMAPPLKGAFFHG